MKKILSILFSVLCLCASSAFAEEEHPVLVLEVRGTVDPALVRYVARGLEQGRQARASAVVLELDTPGGLQGSQRKMMQSILDSPVPVIAYVFPRGAGGFVIAESAQVSVTAPEGEDLGDLLRQAEGRQVKTIFGLSTLALQQRPLRRLPLSLMENVLHRLADPGLAYFLLLLGIYGLVYELARPRAVFPGVLGAILLVLALVALEALEVNWGGIALILLAVFLFIAGIRRQGAGALTAGGIAAFVLGSAFLFPGGRIPSLSLHSGAIGAATLLTAAFFWVVVRSGLKKP